MARLTSTYEPAALEVRLTLALGLTILSPYYRAFARGLMLAGDERVLDFGCGSGICSRHIAARLVKGGRLECVDVSRGWIETARRTLRRFGNVTFHHGHIDALDLPAAAYDLVVIHFVLHDIPAGERSTVAAALARLLKAGGRLAVREPRGHGLENEELLAITAAAGLRMLSLRARRAASGQVYDGWFSRDH